MHRSMVGRARMRARGALGSAIRLALLSVSGAALLLCACSSSGTASVEAGPKRPVEIRYCLVSQGVELALVNTSHTDRTAMYSAKKPLAAASTKVSPDEVVDAMLDYFREQGFFELAQPGVAGSRPAGGVTQVLEVVLPEGAVRAQVAPGMSIDDLRRFQTCAKAFRDVYNNTMQLQAVEQAPDWDGKRPGPPPAPAKKGG